MELQAHMHELQPDFKLQSMSCLTDVLKEAVAKADVGVTSMAKTSQLATKLESDEFELDKTKIEFDICGAAEYRNKVTSRESWVHYKKIEKDSPAV